MSEHPLDLSARLIDSGVVDTPPNRITQELSELAPGVALVESFSHVVVLDTGDGLVCFDTSGTQSGNAVVAAIRRWRNDRFHSLVYTHGHLDHVGGSRSFAADAQHRGDEPPQVVGHERIADRFARYEATSGYNVVINRRQFGAAPKALTEQADAAPRFLPEGTLWPDVVYTDTHTETIGDLRFAFHHCLGETDDHTWTWIPEHKMICAGDQFIWNFPNCGNPQKVQRYPKEWAESLRAMVEAGPELFVPAHGLPIAGAQRIRQCLITVAETLEQLIADVVDAMNAGATLDEIVHSVSVSPETLELPYMRPLYDEPEFVIRNLWRLYGGWWDGNPARLKPAQDQVLGAEIARLAGGVEALIAAALEHTSAEDHAVACHLIEFAVAAEPESMAVHEARAEIYRARRAAESSLMAKGIYGSAAAESEVIRTGEVPPLRMVLSIGEDGS